MTPPRLSILDVPIDPVTLSEAVARMQSMLQSKSQHHVMTPNPEMLVAAQTMPAFLSVLQSASLTIPDGVGLLFAARFLGMTLPERVTGIDVVMKFCKETKTSVFLLGAGTGVAERAAEVLRQSNPFLIIAGTHAGSPAQEEEADILERINTSGTSVLFVAYGAPIQDLWIARNLGRMPYVKIAMGVGGSFDFLAGVRLRAPLWMCSLGLEWLYRLFREPRRIRRIVTAVIVFPFLVARSRFRLR